MPVLRRVGRRLGHFTRFARALGDEQILGETESFFTSGIAPETEKASIQAGRGPHAGGHPTRHNRFA